MTAGSQLNLATTDGSEIVFPSPRAVDKRKGGDSLLPVNGKRFSQVFSLCILPHERPSMLHFYLFLALLFITFN